MSGNNIIFNGKYNNIFISEAVTLDIGKQVIIDEFASINFADAAKIKLGDYVYFNDHCSIKCHYGLTVGKNTIFGDGVRIFDHNHMYSDYHVERWSFQGKGITIGDNCWIGTNCVILSGVTIGDNVIIGAGCVIHDDVPSNSIVYNKGNLVVKSRRQASKHCFVLTLSDQLEALGELLEKMPDVDIHVAAPCQASDYLQSFNKYENFQLYMNVLEEDIQDLINRCDVYLDINYGPEVNNVLGRMHELNKPIFSLETVVHSTEIASVCKSVDEMVQKIQNAFLLNTEK